MKALLLDASSAGDARTVGAADALESEMRARGCTVERRRVAELDVRACTGCFGCWVRTPGECVIADDARSLAAAVIAADVFAVVTPVRFGSYGSVAKSALDRMIPLITPLFTMIDGETHHVARYPRFPHYVALGTSGLSDESALAEEAAAFGRLAGRNAINFHCTSTAVLAGPSDDIAEVAARAAGAVRCPEEVAA